MFVSSAKKALPSLLPSLHSFIHSFHKYLLRAYYVPDHSLGMGDSGKEDR